MILQPVSDWPFIPSHDEVHNDTAQLTDGVIRSSTPMPADELDDSDDGMASSAAWRPCMKIYMYFFFTVPVAATVEQSPVTGYHRMLPVKSTLTHHN